MDNDYDDSQVEDEVEVFDETATETDDGAGGGEGDTDYAEEAKRKAEMVEYLKRDIHDERKKRQAVEARLRELEAHRAQADLSNIDRDVEAARAHYRKVFDEGDGEQVAVAQEKLTELITQRTLLKAQPRQAPEPAEPAAELSPEASNWIARNKWFKAQDSDDLSKKAIAISLELEQSGYNRNSPDLYRELDKRLEAHKPKRAPNAAPVHRGAGRDSGPPGRRITEADKGTMKLFGYDPNNAKHRESWLKRNDPLE